MSFMSAPWLANTAAPWLSGAGTAAGALGAGYGLYQGLRPRKALKGKVTGKFTKKKPKKVLTKRGYKASQEEGRGMTASSFSKKKKDTFTVKALKEAIPQKYLRFNQGICSVAEGNQDWQLLVSDWRFSDLDTFAPKSDTVQKRFYIDSVQQRGMITNTTSTPVKLTMYLLHPKKDLPETDGNPVKTIEYGLRELYNANDMHKTPYVSPRESVQFNSAWKIANEKTVVLSPGENHEYFYNIEIEKYWNSSQSRLGTDGSGTNYYFMKGYTKTIMIKVQPTLVTDSTKVSFASSKVIWLNRSTLKYKIPQGPSTNTLLATRANIPQTGLTSQKYVNEDSGDVDLNVTI